VLPAALAALLAGLTIKDPPLIHATVLFCAGALLASIITDYLRASAAFPDWSISLIAVIMTLGPALFALVVPEIKIRSTLWRSSR
jgi:hypothetical protein